MMGITTFPNVAWNVYAKGCLARMVENWPGTIRVYFEGVSPIPPLRDVEGIELKPLSAIPGYTGFLAREIPKKPGFLWDVKRFSHKAYAQFDAMAEGNPFWWIDADVALFQAVPAGILEQEEMVTFLGRDTYTETGLVGFNPKHPDFKPFEDRYRSMYDDGQILSLPYWTDCHAFDSAREGKGRNLTPNGKGFDNVMKDSPFGEFMAHFKGPLKAQLYRLGGAREVSADLRLD